MAMYYFQTTRQMIFCPIWILGILEASNWLPSRASQPIRNVQNSKKLAKNWFDEFFEKGRAQTIRPQEMFRFLTLFSLCYLSVLT